MKGSKELLLGALLSLCMMSGGPAAVGEGTISAAAGVVNGVQGGGGIDRVIKTPADGYTEVGGQVHIVFDKDALVGANGDQPSVYLGGGGVDVQGHVTVIDAGIEYDKDAHTLPAQNGTVVTLDPGWDEFISRAEPLVPSERVNPQQYNSTAHMWIPVRLQGDTFTIRYIVFWDDGSIQLAVDGAGSFFWNTDPPAAGADTTQYWPSARHGVMDVNHLGTCWMKRVVAMTRKTGLDFRNLDGSWLKCTCSNFYLWRREFDAAGNPVPRRYNWTFNQVDEAGTGYDTPREGSMSWDKRIDGKHYPGFGERIVEFPLLNVGSEAGRKPTLLSGNATESDNSGPPVQQSRYTRETVNINLFEATTLDGAKVLLRHVHP